MIDESLLRRRCRPVTSARAASRGEYAPRGATRIDGRSLLHAVVISVMIAEDRSTLGASAADLCVSRATKVEPIMLLARGNSLRLLEGGRAKGHAAVRLGVGELPWRVW